MWKVARWLFVIVLGWTMASFACNEGSDPPPDGGTSGVGGCPTGPVALFEVTVRAADGQVPADTSLLVRWSAGEEPVVNLLDPGSWPSVAEGANVECDIPEDATPPLELDELTCELWTSGATYVEVSAAGYVTLEETLTPLQIDDCDVPVPSDVELELVRDPDAGV
ncbi:MAG: hypothetical protein JRI23_20990 [Deltaproteobacteria bacterium]|jgi:hypothetical protein|nr:hypothetical protein [Deltaproteobacteria bacterium]MBW2534410.1 hypothetical protein [Deltaproteobacteria bacterium]